MNTVCWTVSVCQCVRVCTVGVPPAAGRSGTDAAGVVSRPALTITTVSDRVRSVCVCEFKADIIISDSKPPPPD
nr:hypothetical protein BaRGS_005300 [Batillaria attramentaria]